MIKALLFDFSRTLLFPKDKSYPGSLNDLYRQVSTKPDFEFWKYFEVNPELFDYLEQIQNKIPLYVFTKRTIQESPELQSKMKIFKKVFKASEMEKEKNDSEAFRIIAKEIGCDPEEIFYTDDDEKNVEAAKSAGFYAVIYRDNSQLITELQKLI